MAHGSKRSNVERVGHSVDGETVWQSASSRASPSVSEDDEGSCFGGFLASGRNRRHEAIGEKIPPSLRDVRDDKRGRDVRDDKRERDVRDESTSRVRDDNHAKVKAPRAPQLADSCGRVTP